MVKKKEKKIIVEYRFNLGITTYIFLTLAIVVLYLIGIEKAYFSLSLLYFVGIWFFDRTVCIFKKEIPK